MTSRSYGNSTRREREERAYLERAVAQRNGGSGSGARLANLSQAEAVDGCKRLEKKKIYCSAIQVTAWNTPNAR